MQQGNRNLSKHDLLKLAQSNPAVFYQYLRESLARVERIPVNKLSNEQVLNAVYEHILCGSIYLNTETLSSRFSLANISRQIPLSSYLSRAKARGAPVQSEYDLEESLPKESTDNENKRWVGFQVTDEVTGKPLAQVELKIQLPDGNVRRFYTDADGVIKIQGLTYGPLHVLEIKHKVVKSISQFS